MPFMLSTYLVAMWFMAVKPLQLNTLALAVSTEDSFAQSLGIGHDLKVMGSATIINMPDFMTLNLI